MPREKSRTDLALEYVNSVTVEHDSNCPHYECHDQTNSDCKCAGDDECTNPGKVCKCDEDTKIDFGKLVEFHKRKPDKPNTNDSVEERLVSRTKEIGSVILDEAIDGGWLTLGKQTAKRSVALGQRILEKRLSFLPATAHHWIGLALQSSDEGLAVYSLALGTVCSAIPRFSNNQYRAKLARSMRVYGWHVLSDRLIDPILDELVEIVDMVLNESGMDIKSKSPPVLIQKNEYVSSSVENSSAPVTRDRRKKARA
jgi:hypothetical protein